MQLYTLIQRLGTGPDVSGQGRVVRNYWPLCSPPEAHMETDNQPTKKRSRPLSGKLALIFIPIGVLAILIVRVLAVEVDFAVANLLTVLISCLLWIAVVVALFTSQASRSLWKLVFAAPWVLLGVVLCLFRVERLDSELKPQFRLRWTPEIELPTSRGTTLSQAADQDQRFVSRETDFPQFLGKNRDGILDGLAIDPDWDASPPEILWKQAIGDGWSGFAVTGDVAITMEQRDDQEWVSAYSIVDGQLLWHYAIPALHTHVAGGSGPRSTPTIANDRVYACSAVSQLACLNLFTGERIWSQELSEIGAVTQGEFEQLVAWGRAGSPLLVNDLVVVPFGGKADDAQPIIAFKAESGEEVWRGGQGQISYGSPILVEIQGVPQILLLGEDHLAAYAPDTGTELWRIPWPGVSNANASVSQPIVLNSNEVFLSKGYGQGARLTKVSLVDGKWQTQTVWDNQRVLRTKFTSCVAHAGYVYGLSDGILECISLATGERQWKKGRYRHGQLLLVGEHLLISSEGGEIVLVKATPDEFVELDKFPVIGDITWNTLTLSGDRLLIRNSDEAACVRIPLLPDKSVPPQSTAEDFDAGTSKNIEAGVL